MTPELRDHGDHFTPEEGNEALKLWDEFSNWLELTADLDQEDPTIVAERQSFLDRMSTQAALHPSIEDLPENAPELVRRRVLIAINKSLPYQEPVDSLSKAVDRYGISLERLRSYNLNWYDEQKLLLATAYAAKSRHTKAGEKLAKKARAILRHEATNRMPDGQSIDDYENENEAIAEVHKRGDHALRQIHAAGLSTLFELMNVGKLPDTAPIPNIDTVLPIVGKNYLKTDTTLWTALQDASDAYVEPLDDSDADFAEIFKDEEPFVNLTSEEIKRRLTQLPIVEDELKTIFGHDSTITYKEVNPLHDISIRDLASSIERADSSDDNEEGKEGSSTFAEYTFLEIIQPDGQTYVIAESPYEANACYVLRGDVVEKVGNLLDTELSWEDIMKYPKETVRQLGAVRFNHTSAGDVVAKIADYVQRPAEETLKQLAQRWLTTSRAAFDHDLEATSDNRLPLSMRAMVATHPESVKELLLQWLETDELPATIIHHLGERALQPKVAETKPETSETELDALKRENAELRTRLEEKQVRELKFIARNKKLRKFIRQLLKES
ncbi:MAG: hypothetical protein JWO99_345 [Candidatus Saccharibacteria bacterium]|nr:hypothetical protein [Candidatus Saccharibacteria bacterium]